ncbi:signal peptidase I [Carnobacteriaceae bacterium zg-ZUI252]|nr:signal peptidase I [Carnobacteriaceae bacterium zg-ZUI252]MBS4769925.1 signal peptidase I [Carnobacteriaceae bacterium zg-ZUI240]
MLMISVLLQMFVVSSFTINGSSMTPTLAENQSMMMWKLSAPSRFDVVVIEAPDQAYEYDKSGQIKKDLFGNDVKKLYIKRVIGMPGDTLEYKNDELYINGKKYDEPYLDASRKIHPAPYMQDRTLAQYMEYARTVIPNLPQENTQLAEKNGVMVIPDDYYFVLGDNRLNSKDSEEYGLVHKRLFKGIVFLRISPLNKIGIAPF